MRRSLLLLYLFYCPPRLHLLISPIDVLNRQQIYTRSGQRGKILAIYCKLRLLFLLPTLTRKLFIFLSSILRAILLSLLLGLWIHCATDEDLGRLIERVICLTIGSPILNLHLLRPSSTTTNIVHQTHSRKLHPHLRSQQFIKELNILTVNR